MNDTSADETIEELKAAIAELESGEGLTRFVEGHGLQSRAFVFSWHAGHLAIDFRLPYARVLSRDETQAEDAARLGAALRLAILLISADGEGKLLSEGEDMLSVRADEGSLGYTVTDAQGETLDFGDSWDSLVARLDNLFANGPQGLQIIWP